MNQLGSRYKIFHYCVDALIVIGALMLASYLRISVDVGLEGPNYAFETPLFLFAVTPIIWFFAFQQTQVYEENHTLRHTHKIRQIITGNILAGLIFLGLLYLTYRDYSRLQSVYFILFVVFGTLFYRELWRVIAHVFRFDDDYPILIIGYNANAAALSRQLVENRRAHSHLRFVGFLQFLDEKTPKPFTLGTVSDLMTVVQTHRIREVVIAFKWYDHDVSEQISRIVRHLQGTPTNIRLAPDYSDLALFRQTTEDFGGVPLIGLRETIFTPSQEFVKRTFDILIAGAALIVTAPLMLLITLLIRLDSPGAVLFGQCRAGRHGQPFTMYKFRTMYAAVDQPTFDETVINIIKRPHDPRVTRVGRFLRRTSLDEMPQLVNVLRGEMSIVGPRPEMPERVDQYEWWQHKRFEVPQGMTGWWQINGRADRPMHKHTEDDLYYIENYSLWLDIRIIMQTVLVVITGKGAF